MPRIALLSDIHANIHALEGCIFALEKENPDFWLCLGDMVGYGPNPIEVIELIQTKEMRCVKGNHDAGVTGDLSLKHFRNLNRNLIQKTQSLLEKKHIEWLRSLPLVIEGGLWIASHASPINPNEWVYIESAFKARDILAKIEKQLCFVGHTHRPALVADTFGVNKFKEGMRFFINPGSVGQSRDGDYRSSCSIIDTEKWEYKNIRLEFDIDPVLTSLMKLGFTGKEAYHLLGL